MADEKQDGTVHIDNVKDKIKQLVEMDEAATKAEAAAKADAEAEAFDTVTRKEGDMPEGTEPITKKTDGDGDESGGVKEAAKKGGGSSSLLLYALLGVLVLAIVVGVMMVVKMMGNAGTPSAGDAVNQPNTNIANNANFIYVPAPEEGASGAFLLQKYVADRLGTVFHFAEPLPEGCALTLTDNFGRPYYCDTRRTGGKLAYFPPLAGDTQSFTLTVADASGAQLGLYELTELGLNAAAVFFDADAVAASDNESEWESTMRLAGAQLSSSGTTIWLLADTAFLPGADGIADMVKLEENLGIVLKAGAPQVLDFVDDGISMIRLDFAAIKSLHSKLRLTVRDTAAYIPVAQSFPLEDLLTDDKAKDVAVDLGTHTLMLEGLLKSKTGYTLVMHTEDLAVAANPDRPYANRTEGVPDAVLVLEKDGQTIEIKGTVQSKKEGSDVRFDLAAYAADFAAAEPTDISLRVDGVRVKLGDTVMNVDLSAASAERAPNEAVRNAVEAYYADSNIVDKTGYEVYAESAAEVGGTVYATVREGWMEHDTVMTRESITSGTVNRGVYTAVVDEAVSDAEDE